MPDGVETGFTERANFGPADPATFPAGAHLCEVEIDEETGEVALTRYAAVDDVGRVLNSLLCEGQIHGGIVQGVRQALMEDVVYDPASGQLARFRIIACRAPTSFALSTSRTTRL